MVENAARGFPIKWEFFSLNLLARPCAATRNLLARPCAATRRHRPPASRRVEFDDGGALVEMVAHILGCPGNWIASPRIMARGGMARAGLDSHFPKWFTRKIQSGGA